MSDNIFKKRSGTTNDGINFENMFMANLITTLISDESITDFKLSSNNENFGDLDDVVLEIQRNNCSQQNYALQLKYSRNSRWVSPQQLTTEKGDFSIKKYYKAVLNILNDNKVKDIDSFKWILFTNREFADNRENNTKNENFCLKIKNCEPEPALRTTCVKTCLQFQTDKVEDKDHQYQTFLERFYLYANGPSIELLSKQGSNKLQTNFNAREAVFKKLLKFIVKWNEKTGEKEKLNKSVMKQVVVMHLLSPLIRPMLFTNTEKLNIKAELFQKAISSFKITLLEDGDGDAITQIWNNLRQNLQHDADVMKEINTIGRRYQIIPTSVKQLDYLNDKVLTILIWLMGIGPLIVSDHSSVYEAIKLCEDKKFVVLRNEVVAKDFQNCSVFRDLSDLETIEDTYLSVLQSFTCSLQGKEEITLEALIQENKKIKRIITTTKLVQMVGHPLCIDPNTEEIPPVYIERLLTCNFVDYTFLKKSSLNTLIIISGLNDINKLKIHLQNVNIVMIVEQKKGDLTFEEFFVNVKNIDKYAAKRIYVYRKECCQKIFNIVCERNPSYASYHNFRSINDTRLQWVRSKGDINELEEFRMIQDHCIQESRLETQTENNINVICGPPGIGKTILSRNMKNTLFAQLWTVLIYPKDYSKYLRENGQDPQKLIQFILSKITEEYSSFDLKLFEIFKEQNRMCLIWDGMDEVSNENLETFLNAVIYLSRDGIKQWITSRDNLKTEMENKFNVLSRRIKPFNNEEQNVYIKHRLNCSDDHIESIFKNISTSSHMFRFREVLGIPIQIFIFTELFCQNPEKYNSLLGNISLANLYEYFIDEKFNVFFKEKKNENSTADIVYEDNKKYQKHRIEQYEKAAIKIHFPTEVLQSLRNIDCEKFLNEICRTKDPVGIIRLVTTENIPFFSHNSYGEYFAALYLSKYFKDISNLEFVFDKRYDNVRFFFDLLLAKDCPAHLAVITRNAQELKNMNKQLLTLKDQGGRSPLHLACWWGEKYPTLYTRQIRYMYFKKYVVYDKSCSVKKENPEYQDILEYLSDHCDPYEKDEIFKYNSFVYADKAYCIYPLVVLSSQHKIKFNDLHNFKDIAIVIYYSIMLNSVNVLNTMKAIPLLETQKLRKSILLLAVKYNSINCLEKMITYKIYKKEIKKIDVLNHLISIACKNGNCEIVEFLLKHSKKKAASILHKPELLHVSCEEGHHNIVKFLLDYQVDINTPDELDLMPIHRALDNKHYDTVQLLIENNTNVNIPNPFNGMMPLHLACIEGHLKLVILLVSKNANINAADELSGMSAIHYACIHGHLEIVTYLCDNDADFNMLDKYYKMPIYYAFHNKHYEIVKTLITRQVNVNILCHNNMNLMHLACYEEQMEILQLLITHDANVNVIDACGETPLHIACKYGRSDIVQLLLANGVEVDVANRVDGSMPIHYASASGHYDIVKLLVGKANVEAKDKYGWTAMHWASAKGHCDIVQLLIIESNANVNVLDDNGELPIHFALANGHSDILRLLIDSGSEINLANKTGYMLIHYACATGDRELITSLITRNADLNVQDQYGRMPIHWACVKGHHEIVRLLNDNGVTIDTTFEQFSTELAEEDDEIVEVLKYFEQIGSNEG